MEGGENHMSCGLDRQTDSTPIDTMLTAISRNNNANDHTLYNGELYHYGVKGMKWGVRKPWTKSSNSVKSAKKRQDKVHIDLQNKERGKKLYNMAKKGAKTTSQVMAKLGVAYVADQVLFDGVGTDAVKFAMKVIGRTTITAIDKVRK